MPIDDTEQLRRRKKLQETLSLAPGKNYTVGEVKNCRKIFMNVIAGTVDYSVTGDLASSGRLSAPWQGGALTGEGHGGHFDEADLTFSITGVSQADVYIHVEWTLGLNEWSPTKANDE